MLLLDGYGVVGSKLLCVRAKDFEKEQPSGCNNVWSLESVPLVERGETGEVSRLWLLQLRPIQLGNVGRFGSPTALASLARRCGTCKGGAKVLFRSDRLDLSAVLVSTYLLYIYLLCSGTSAALGADDLPSSSQGCLAVYDLICLFTVLVRRLQVRHQPTTAYFRRAADFHPLPGMVVPCQRLHCYLRDPLYQARDSPCLPSAHSFLIVSSVLLRCNIDLYSRI